jgi:hypothetical protein
MEDIAILGLGTKEENGEGYAGRKRRAKQKNAAATPPLSCSSPFIVFFFPFKDLNVLLVIYYLLPRYPYLPLSHNSPPSNRGGSGHKCRCGKRGRKGKVPLSAIELGGSHYKIEREFGKGRKH